METMQIEFKGRLYIAIPKEEYDAMCGSASCNPQKVDSSMASAADLSNWRKAAGYTQAEVADLAGVDRTTIIRIESGCGKVKFVNINKIVVVLEKALAWDDFVSGKIAPKGN